MTGLEGDSTTEGDWGEVEGVLPDSLLSSSLGLIVEWFILHDWRAANGPEVHRHFTDDASLERPFMWVVISLYDTAKRLSHDRTPASNGAVQFKVGKV